MLLPGLGISKSDVRILAENVSVVFHSAATVRFDEPLQQAVEMNLKGTKKLIDLCKQMSKIDVSILYIHIRFLQYSQVLDVFLPCAYSTGGMVVET